MIPRTHLLHIPLFRAKAKHNNMTSKKKTISPEWCRWKRTPAIQKDRGLRPPPRSKIGTLTLAAFAGKVANPLWMASAFTDLPTLPRKSSHSPSPFSFASLKHEASNTPNNRFSLAKRFLDDQPIRGGDSAIQNKWRLANAQRSEKYHLIWSPTFLKRMILGAVVWMFLRNKVLQSKSLPLNEMFHGWTCPENAPGDFSTAVILPLLSSSCCAIQLMINIVSGLGCAGFNTYLGEHPFST